MVARRTSKGPQVENLPYKMDSESLPPPAMKHTGVASPADVDFDTSAADIARMASNSARGDGVDAGDAELFRWCRQHERRSDDRFHAACAAMRASMSVLRLRCSRPQLPLAELLPALRSTWAAER